MAVYLDVIWFLNFCIDLLLLFLTSTVLKRTLALWRLVFAAVVASSIIFLLLTPMAYLYANPIFKIAFSLLIVFIAFGFRRFSFVLQNLLMFYFVSFICGGGMIALHYFFNTDMIIANGVVETRGTGFGSPVSWAFIVIVFPIVWFYARQQLKHIEVRKIKYEEIVQVEILINNVELKLAGLIDSGNQLADPITRKPVMIIDMNSIHDHFPVNLIEQAKNPERIGDEAYRLTSEWEARMTIIPYRVVGQNSQFLIGLKPDNVNVLLKDGQKLNCSHVIVALNFTTLSADGDFQCILHPKMLINANEMLA